MNSISIAIRRVLTGGMLAGGLVAGLAQAQSAAPPVPADDGSLTYKGITLYGIVDLGLQYESHGAPVSDYFPGGTGDIIQKNGNNSVFGVVPSNLSQSRIGLKGSEPLPMAGDFSAVFKLETFFNPQSGELSDGLKSLTQNNGKALAVQTTGIDTSVAGQVFQQSYLGISSPTFGTLTFGRHNTLLADGIAKYDPEGASQAFSVIGISGTTAGGGDTENRRFSNSLKYTANFSGVHVGAMWKFNQATGGANTALEANLGYEIQALSVDAFYTKVNDAVSAGSLSAAQVAELPTLGYSSNNALSGTISDNTSYSLMASYNLGGPKLFAGYEWIQYANPTHGLTAGTETIGGYVLAFVNNEAFPNNKYLQVYWAGVKYPVATNFDVTAAYYGYHQNAYGTGANAGCSTALSGTCAGALNAFSLAGDYRLSKRFDTYAGFMWSGVRDGLANGYLYKNNWNPTIGLRFQF